MKKETYALRDGAIVFTADTPANGAEAREAVLGLSDDLILALCENALSQWSYRKGAKKENNGVHFGFAAAVADMATVSERNTGPSKADIKAAEDWWKKEWAVVCASLPVGVEKPKPTADKAEHDAYEEIAGPVRHQRIAKMHDVVVAKIAANNAHHKDLAFEADSDATDVDNIKSLYRAVRLYENKMRTGAV